MADNHLFEGRGRDSSDTETESESDSVTETEDESVAEDDRRPLRAKEQATIHDGERSVGTGFVTDVDIEPAGSLSAGRPILAFSFWPNQPLTRFEQRINQAFAGASEYFRTIVQVWYSTILVCVRCQAEFREIANVGRWYCKMHTGDFIVKRDVPKHWSCCGQQYYGSPGCVRADHTVHRMAYTTADNVVVPVHFARGLFTLFPDSHTIESTEDDGGTANTVIPRFDMAAAEKLYLNHASVRAHS